MTNTTTSLLTILAIFAGPITALWVQRILDARREQDKRRRDLFNTLWATRSSFATRLHYRHVEALNMIEIEFQGKMAVINVWREYLSLLNVPNPDTEVARDRLFSDRDKKIKDLVYEMSRVLRYKFTRLEVDKQWYRPVAHDTWANQETALRQGIVSLLKGEDSLPVRLVEQTIKSDKSGVN
jgi:hypothetical protein